MYQDAKEELQRLEEALLEDEIVLEELPEELAEDLFEDEESEQPDGELEKTRRITVLEDIPQTPKQFYNTDRADVELEEYAQQVQEESRGLVGLTVTAILLAAGIVGVLIWWFLRYRGMLG